MKAQDIMTPNPSCVTPDTSLQEAARLMKLAVDAYVERNASLGAALDDIDDGLDQLHRDYIEAIFESAKNPNADFMLPLHFAYAKALDDRGQHEKALEHYIQGGKMKRAPKLPVT